MKGLKELRTSAHIIDMNFVDAITVVVTGPFALRMINGAVMADDVVVVLPFIRTGVAIIAGELMDMRFQSWWLA